MFSRIKHTMLAIALFAISACAIFYIQDTYIPDNRQAVSAEYDDFFMPNSEYVKFMSAGFDAAVADYYWIRVVLYFGDRLIGTDNDFMGYSLRDEDLNNPEYLQWLRESQFRTRHLYGLLNMVTDLNPYFVRPYLFGGLFLAMKSGRPDQAISLLEKGLKYHSDNYRFYEHLGFNYLFYMNDKQKAAENFLKASQYPDAPSRTRDLAKGILVENGRAGAAIAFFEGLLEKEENEGLRSELESLIMELKTKSDGKK